MHIGFDFDNTIVSYDSLFHKIALEQGAIDASVPVNKLAVRDHLRSLDLEDVWTVMQGYVYGARMSEAEAYQDAIQTMLQLKAAGHTLAIVSHKTKYPYLGQQYDLHAAAKNWIDTFLTVENQPLIANDQIFFELTKEDKIARIETIGCDVFIDDLPEILMAPRFPISVKRFLFDPEDNHANTPLSEVNLISSWKAFGSHLL